MQCIQQECAAVAVPGDLPPCSASREGWQLEEGHCSVTWRVSTVLIRYTLSAAAGLTPLNVSYADLPEGMARLLKA